MNVWLDEDLARQAPKAPEDAFQWVMQLDGETVRRTEKRHTFRIALNGKKYFIKQHHGPMWWEACTDVLRFSRPVLGADHEFRMSRTLQKIGVPVAEPSGVGVSGAGLWRKSFLITKALPESLTVNQLARSWWDSPVLPHAKRAIIRAVATLVRKMHAAGINHRDLYINHFRIVRADLESGADPKIYVMDLHRAQQRRRVPRRWLIKDLAALLFSCLDKPLTLHDLLYFLKWYHAGVPLHESLGRNRKFWNDVVGKAFASARRRERKEGGEMRHGSLGSLLLREERKS